MTNAWKSLANITVAIACSIFAVGAHAGNVRGNWDPVFSGQFADTGFRGEVTFYVPNDCLLSTGWKANGSCGVPGDMDMYLIDAKVWLYDTSDGVPPFPDLPGMPIDFFPGTQSLDPINLIMGVDVQANKVVGLDTRWIGPEDSLSSSQAPPFLSLILTTGFSLEGADPGAYLQGCTFVGTEIPVCETSQFELSNTGVVTYTPEPGSLALLLGALGAGWYVRRRTVAA